MGIADAGTAMTLHSAAPATILIARAFTGHLLLLLPVPKKARQPRTRLDGITDAGRRTDERRRTCLRKRCSGLASLLASLLGGSSQLNTSGRYFAPRRASMPCVRSSSCTVSDLSGSHS